MKCYNRFNYLAAYLARVEARGVEALVVGGPAAHPLMVGLELVPDFPRFHLCAHILRGYRQVAVQPVVVHLDELAPVEVRCSGASADVHVRRKEASAAAAAATTAAAAASAALLPASLVLRRPRSSVLSNISTDAALFPLALVVHPRCLRTVVALDDDGTVCASSSSISSSSFGQRPASTLAGALATGAAPPSAGLSGGSCRCSRGGFGTAAGAVGGSTAVNCVDGAASDAVASAAYAADGDAATVYRLGRGGRFASGGRSGWWHRALPGQGGSTEDRTSVRRFAPARVHSIA